MIEFSRTAYPVAKKQHVCEQCSNVIKKGERYAVFVGVDSGSFFSYKHHLDCLSFVEAYCKDQADDEYDPWCVTDWVEDRVCKSCFQFETCELHPLHCEKAKDKIIPGWRDEVHEK